MLVLFVDDSETNRAVVRAMLAAADVQLIEAENGRLGVEQVGSRDDIDLVLMDLRMPVMDGAAAIAAIRARSDAKAGLPIILVTADAAGDLQSLAPGADAFLPKPISMADLFATIAGLMTSGRLSAAA